MRFRMISLISAVCLAAILGFAFIATAAQTISIAVYQSATHECAVWFNELAPMLAKMSNNKLQAKIYDSGTIGKEKDILDAVQRNLADVGFEYPGYHSPAMPVLEVCAMSPSFFAMI